MTNRHKMTWGRAKRACETGRMDPRIHLRNKKQRYQVSLLRAPPFYQFPFTNLYLFDSHTNPRTMAANEVAPYTLRVFSFSPLTVEATWAKASEYDAEHSPSTDSPAQDVARKDRALLRRLHTAQSLPNVVRVAAGLGSDIEMLQAVLGPSITISGVSPDSMIAVGNLEYAFRWPMEMRMQGSDNPSMSNAFQLKGGDDCFLARSFTDVDYDTLVVYVERGNVANVSVMFVGLPKAAPPRLLGCMNKEDMRRELLITHALIIANGAKRPNRTESRPELGVATLLNVKSKDAMNLEEIMEKKLPSGRKLDTAVHVCRFGMDEAGGFVQAAALMISKGLRFSQSVPVDIDFRKYPNGYLVFVEVSSSGATADDNPACLAAAWVNIPSEIHFDE